MSAPHPWYGARVSVLSVGLLASSAVLLLLMLQHFVGPFRFRSGDPVVPVRTSVLWLPAAAGADAAGTRRRIDGWRRVKPAALEHGRTLAELGAPERLLLVVPDARRVDPTEARMLRRFVEEGGGLVLSGSVGVRDAAGEWRGYGIMAELLDTPRVEPLPAERAALVLPIARGPLTSPLPPGTTLALVPEPGAPALADASAELAWSAGAEGDLTARAASRRITPGRGRLVWLATGPENATEGPDGSMDDLDNVLRAAITWAAGEPIAELLPSAALDGTPQRAAWHRLSDDVDASARRVGPRRVLVEVSNRGDADVGGAALRLYLGRRFGDVTIAATTVGQALPELRASAGDDRLALLLPALQRGSHAWHLDWTTPAGRIP